MSGILRIKALYEGQRKIIGLVASILVLETAVNAWLMTHGEGVLLPLTLKYIESKKKFSR